MSSWMRGLVFVLTTSIMLVCVTGAGAQFATDPTFSPRSLPARSPVPLQLWSGWKNDLPTSQILRSGNDLIVVRYDRIEKRNQNWRLVTSWGNNGIVEAPDGENLWTAALRSDGSLVFADSHHVYAVDANGDTLISFGISGAISTTNWSSVATLSDDSVVVLTEMHEGYRLSRYLPNGALDQSWGTNGNLATGLKDAKFVTHGTDTYVSGRGAYKGLQRWATAIRKYTVAGTLDQSWGTSGTATLPHNFNAYIVDDMLPDDTGLWISGFDYEISPQGGSPYKPLRGGFIDRLTTQGTLDTSFAGDGELKPGGNPKSLVAVGDRVAVLGALPNDNIGGTLFNARGKVLQRFQFEAGTLSRGLGSWDLNWYMSDGVLDSNGRLWVTTSGPGSGVYSGNTGFPLGNKPIVVRFAQLAQPHIRLRAAGRKKLCGINNPADLLHFVDNCMYRNGARPRIVGKVTGGNANIVFLRVVADGERVVGVVKTKVRSDGTFAARIPARFFPNRRKGREFAITPNTSASHSAGVGYGIPLVIEIV